MKLGGVFIWTISYGLMKKSAEIYGQMRDESKTRIADDNKSDVYQEVNILYAEIGEDNKEQQVLQIPLSSSTGAGQGQSVSAIINLLLIKILFEQNSSWIIVKNKPIYVIQIDGATSSKRPGPKNEDV